MGCNLEATIFNIGRCSLHDGNGLRTVVYFKGCSMRCLWCHNPESWNKKPELLFYPNKCIGCGRLSLIHISEPTRLYERSGGGVTFSGGECLLWPEFLKELMEACRKENINIAVETALNVSWENVLMASKYADSFFCDIKHSDSNIHKRLTGAGLSLIHI